MTTVPIYFETSWSILSTLGLVNVLFGLIVLGITGYSPIAMVPIVVSVAGAIANGMCYYAEYADYSTRATAAAGIVADLGWLVEEAGLSFYSFMILNRVLRNRERQIFLAGFWVIIVIIFGIRMGILSCRAEDTMNHNIKLQDFITHLHTGYFVFLALIEIHSAVFLLRIFARAKKNSVEVGRGGLFHYLTHSTELRISTLALIGISRAITYSFQSTTIADSVSGQIDRFVFTLECVFPMIMYIDILASRVARAGNLYQSSSNQERKQRSHTDKDVKLYSISQRKSKALVYDESSSSQERIVGVGEENLGGKSRAGTIESHSVEGNDVRPGMGNIVKTVEFEFHNSAV